MDIKDEIVKSSPEGVLDESLDHGSLPGTPPDHSTVPLLQEIPHGHYLHPSVGGTVHVCVCVRVCECV